ncbi:MAG: LapA family protein [Thermodesulfobacteriota bacterium]
MRKFKILLTLIILTVLGTIFYQNKSYFLAAPLITFNVYFRQYEFANISNATMILGAFIVGVLITYFMTLAQRYRTSKTVKNLQETISQQQETITGLRSQVENQPATSSYPSDASIVDAVVKEA